MYGGFSHLRVGAAPVAVVGLYSIQTQSLLWILIAGVLPVVLLTLFFSVMLFRQELTEAEAMDVSFDS